MPEGKYIGHGTDAPASSTVAEDTTSRAGISLWKGIKNILILLNAKFAALGQAAMAASMPVAIANNQSAVPVSGTFWQTTQPVSLATAPALVAGTANVGKVDVPTATPTIYNVTLTSADTEYSQAMPTNCRRFEWQCRTENTTRYAFVTGKVATPTAPYMTLKAGDYEDSGPINQAASPSTLYLASSTAGVVVEIVAWV